MREGRMARHNSHSHQSSGRVTAVPEELTSLADLSVRQDEMTIG
jgi:hypothetical protein